MILNAARAQATPTQADQAGASRFLRLFSGGIAVCAFIAVIAILLLYLAHFYRSYFSSDDAVLNMLAQSMWEQGRLLPQGWINNNGDLMVPSGVLIVAPLLHWLPNGFSVHAAASIFAVLLQIGSLLWLLRVLEMPRAVIAFLATLVASGFSFDITIMVFAQTTYVWWSAGFFLGAALIARQRLPNSAPGRSRWLRPALLGVLVFCISFANPGRVGLMMVFPLYLFDRVLAHGLGDGEEATTRWLHMCRLLGVRDPVTMFGLGMSFVAASVLYAALAHLGITHASYNAASLHWGGVDSVRRHVATFQGWFDYLGAGVNSNEMNPSAFGDLRFFRWGIAIWLTGVGLSELLRLYYQSDAAHRAMAAAFTGAFVPIFLVYILFEPLAVNAGALRYFTVAIFIITVLSAFSLRNLLRFSPRAGRVVLATAGALLIPVSAQHFLPIDSLGRADFWNVKSSRTMQLAQVLQREHLRWGYATWWNAGATTVQADSSILVRPVDLDPGGLAPFAYMVLPDWYRPDAWKGETFLALTHDEATPSHLDQLLETLGKPLRTIESADYRILVFDRNISADFTCARQAPMNEPIVRGVPSTRIVSARLYAAGTARSPSAINVRIRNEGTFPVSGSGRYPMSVGLQLLDGQGVVIEPDWVHSPLHCPIEPGKETIVTVVLPDAAPAGSRIRVDLVQEGVAWLSDWGVTPIEIPLVAQSGPDYGPARSEP